VLPDALRKQRRLVECVLNIATHLFEERLGCRGVGPRRLSGELQVDRKRDQVLLYAVV
jgi:hypothetical protein